MSLSAQQILEELRSRGAMLRRDGDRLVLRAGDRAIPQSLVAQARSAKHNLLTPLEQGGDRVTPRGSRPLPTTKKF